jgi:hypothetical protein
MKKLLLILFLFPAIAFCQKGYFQFSGNVNLNNDLKNGFGGSIMAGQGIGKYYSIGAGFDIMKYHELSKTTPTIYGDLRFNFGSNTKKPIAYFTLTPGYFFYKDYYQVGNYSTQLSGGFFIGTGLGLILYSGTNVAPFISVMYNRFDISSSTKDLSSKVDYNVVKLSFGIHF